MQAGPSQHELMVDATEVVADHLCPIFSEADFATNLSPTHIQRMLEAELQTQIPVPVMQFMHFNSLFPGLLRSSSVENAIPLLQVVGLGLGTAAPRGRPSELYYTSFWQAVGFGLPEFISHLLGVPLESSR